MRSASSYYIIPAQIARSQISFSNYFMNLWLRRTNILDFSFLSPPDKFTMLLSLTVLSFARPCSLLSSPLLVYWTQVVPLDLRYMVSMLPTICIHFGCFLSKYVFKMFFKRQYSCWLTDLASYTATFHGTLPHESNSSASDAYVTLIHDVTQPPGHAQFQLSHLYQWSQKNRGTRF